MIEADVSLTWSEPQQGLPRSGTPPNLRARIQRGLPEKRPIKDVKKVIAVSSAKGGVGKSTVSGLHSHLLLNLMSKLKWNSKSGSSIRKKRFEKWCP